MSANPLNLGIQDETKLRYAHNLSKALEFKTISFLDKEHIQPGEFLDLHDYLASTYPLAHEQLSLEKINDLSLLYTWKGSDPALNPVLLMGHIDVVPVEEGTEDHWEFPPFGGMVQNGAIWGRGTMDCKGSVVGILEAVESLLAKGFQPTRTVYLAFGHDEEIGGNNGAAIIARLLKEKSVQLEAVLDEGLAVLDGVIKLSDRPIALVGIAEKGYLTLELCASSSSGHSSTPPKETATGILAKAVIKLEQNPLPARLGEIPKMMFNNIAPGMPAVMRFLFRFQSVFKPVILRALANNPATNALIRTTTAVTIFQAGSKDNVLPHQAKAAVNFRILPGDTVDGVINFARKTIDDPRIDITPKLDFSMNPSPVSNAASSMFLRLEKVIRGSFNDVVVSPGLVLGATDSRHYQPLSENCFRFSPLWITPDDLNRVHGTNERMTIQNFTQAIAFYQAIIEQWSQA